MLDVQNIHSYYGSSYILQGISLRVNQGEVVSLIGRNGVGKTTALKSIIGIVKPASGSIKYKGVEIIHFDTFKIARLGIGYVPEDRRIYPELTVRENLEIPQVGLSSRGKRWNFEKVFELFPHLKGIEERRIGSNLSGGEQQMLSIARTLMGNPEFILLDEPSEGLAPVVVSMLASAVNEIRKEGVSILVSEQNMRFAMKTTTRAYVIDGGRIFFEGTIEDLQKNEEMMRKHLAV